MNIFIDESGTFVQSAGARGISLVGALIIPEARMAHIERKYEAIRKRLPKEKNEVKGRLLTGSQIAEVTELLRRNEAILELVAIDLNFHSDADISAHKLDQAACMTRGLTDEHHPNWRPYLSALAERIAALPNQLYVQGCAMMELVWSVCDVAINYYGQRRPKELGQFHWTIDGKGKTKTNWEDLWETIFLPLLQSKSIRKPHGIFEGCDLTHFSRFVDTRPDWLPKPPSVTHDEVTNIKMLFMEHFRYSPEIEAGLELVDILTSATRRVLVGSLDVPECAGIPKLMIHRRDHYIRLVALHERQIVNDLPYRSAMKGFTHGGRDLIAPRFWKDE